LLARARPANWHARNRIDAPTELITVSLLHDIGHLLNLKGDIPSARGFDDQNQIFATHFLKEFFLIVFICQYNFIPMEKKRFR